MKNKPLTIGNTVIQPGERVTLGLPTPELSTYTSMHIPIHVLHGKKRGPILLVCSTIHGDEMNGISIIHKLLGTKFLKSIKGTLLAVPVVNVYGLMTLTRKLPDRRDLDGSFPGSQSGSFAARLAHHFTKEIVGKATHCIDIHSGELHQQAMPQIQTNLDFLEAKQMALTFQSPVVIHTKSKRGLLWQNELKIPTLIYETGEPLRHDERGIQKGFQGIINVMRSLNMLISMKKSQLAPVVVKSQTWLRAPGSGLWHLFKKLGQRVKKGDLLADIYDPFGTLQKFQIFSPHTGIITNHNTLPLVNEGDPIVKLARTQEEINPMLWEQNWEK